MTDEQFKSLKYHILTSMWVLVHMVIGMGLLIVVTINPNSSFVFVTLSLGVLNIVTGGFYIFGMVRDSHKT